MLQEKWEALTENVRRTIEIIAGLLVAGGCSFFLMNSTANNDNIYSTLAAVALALLLPRWLQTQTGSKLILFRTVMLVGLVIVVIIMILLALQNM